MSLEADRCCGMYSSVSRYQLQLIGKVAPHRRNLTKINLYLVHNENSSYKKTYSQDSSRSSFSTCRTFPIFPSDYNNNRTSPQIQPLLLCLRPHQPSGNHTVSLAISRFKIKASLKSVTTSMIQKHLVLKFAAVTTHSTSLNSNLERKQLINVAIS